MLGLIHITATPQGTFAGNYNWFTVKHPDYAPHDLVDPSTGEEANFVPYDQPSKALVNALGGVETNNRPGGLYQVEVVAEYECGGYSDEWYAFLRDWLEAKSEALGIPFVIYPGTERFTFEQWEGPLSGWYRHCNVPENDHPCSKLLDLSRLQPKETTDLLDLTQIVEAHAGGDRSKPLSTYTLHDYLVYLLDCANNAEKSATEAAASVRGLTAPSIVIDYTKLAQAVADEIAKRLIA